MRHVVLGLVWFGTSCSASPHPARLQPPLQGALLSADTRAAPRIDRILVDQVPMPLGWGGASPGEVVVARSMADLERAGVTPATPIDFTRWLVLIPPGDSPPGSVTRPERVVVLTAAERDGEAQLWRVTGDEVQVRYMFPCRACGGASYVADQARVCRASLEPRVYLVPRPARRLVVGVVDPSCDPSAP